MKSIANSTRGRGFPARQRGGVAIMFGLTLVVLIGFIGLSVDLGRFFVIKSELQNAMDACALSAASQLKPGANDPNALTKAVAYGKVFITGGVAGAGKTGNDPNIQNRVNFQNVVPDANVIEITFAMTNNGSYQNAATADPNTAKFVKCNYPLAGLPIFFMRVLNPLLDTQTVRAWAVATRDAPLSSCVPVAICSDSSGNAGNNFNFQVGQWIAVAPNKVAPGFFGWIDFTPPSGGASEVKDLLVKGKQCDVSKIGAEVGENGVMSNLEEAWNSRFGWYKNGGGYTTAEAPPDQSGYAYSGGNDPSKLSYDPQGNWKVSSTTSQPNAYSGTSVVPNQKNFIQARAANLPYQADLDPQFPKGIPSQIKTNQYGTPLDGTQLGTLGRSDRRIVAAPVVGCTDTPKTIKGWACVLMLSPIDSTSEDWQKGQMEFLGLATTADSPCGGGSEYAISPVLTQ